MLGILQHTAREKYFSLPIGESKTDRNFNILGQIFKRCFISAFDRRLEAFYRNFVELINLIVIILAFECEGNYAEVYEVCYVDSGKALCDYRPDTEILGYHSGVLT